MTYTKKQHAIELINEYLDGYESDDRVDALNLLADADAHDNHYFGPFAPAFKTDTDRKYIRSIARTMAK